MINGVVAIFINVRRRHRKVIDLLSGITILGTACCVLVPIADLFTDSCSFKVIVWGRVFFYM